MRSLVGALAAGSFGASETLNATAPISAAGLDVAGGVVAAGDSIAFEEQGGTLFTRALYAAGDDPLETGPVRGVAPRLEGGAWIGAARGLFLIDGLYLAKSSLSVGSGAVSALASAMRGPLAGLWIGAPEGLYWRQADSTVRLGIVGLDGAVSQLAMDSAGAIGAVIAGDALVILLPGQAGALLSLRPPIPLTGLRGLAAGGGAVYAASAEGLLRYRASDDPPWTFLSPSPEPFAARAVGAEASGAAWVLGKDQIYRVDLDGGWTSFPAPPALAAGTATAAMTIDGAGDLWFAAGSSLEHRGKGASAAVSFQTDVLPFIVARCAECHSNQTADFRDRTVFAARAEVALARVITGDMPRCAGGLACPSEQHLKPADYEVLDRWIRAGKPD
ncbi:MAG: hypothetical protein U1E65_05830 [Myxococcota bacterium]